MTSSDAQAWNTKHILLNNLESKQSGNEIWPVYVMLQSKIFLSKNSVKYVAWKLVPGPF